MNHNSDIWEEWMGYCVYYMNWNNEGPFIDPSTDYGIPLVSALSTMNAILQTGRCAWVAKINPEQALEVPF